MLGLDGPDEFSGQCSPQVVYPLTCPPIPMNRLPPRHGFHTPAVARQSAVEMDHFLPKTLAIPLALMIPASGLLKRGQLRPVLLFKPLFELRNIDPARGCGGLG